MMFDNKRTLLIRTQEHECGGLYKVVLGRKQNGYPVWCCKGERWLYSTRDPEGAWHVTDDESDLETGNALLCCKESHFGCPPDLCSTWQSADGKGRWKVLLQDDFSLVSIDTAASSKRIPPTESDHLIGVRGISPPRTPQRQHRNYKIDSCDRLHQMEIRNHGGNRKPAQYFRDGNSDLAAFEEQLSVLSELAQSPDVDRKLQFLKTLSPTRSKPSEFRNPSHHAINRYQEFPSNQYLDGYPASHLQQVEQSSNVFCEPTQSRCSKPHDSGCRIVPDIISKKAASTPGVQTYFEYPKTLQREDSTDEMLKLTSELVELQMENLKLVREQKVRVSEFDKLSNSHRELYSRYEQVQQQHLQHKQQQHLRQQWHEHQEVAVLQMQQRGSETSREEQDQQSDLSQSKSLEDAEKEKLERINSSSHLYTTPVATPESVRPSSVQQLTISHRSVQQFSLINSWTTRMNMYGGVAATGGKVKRGRDGEAGEQLKRGKVDIQEEHERHLESQQQRQLEENYLMQMQQQQQHQMMYGQPQPLMGMCTPPHYSPPYGQRYSPEPGRCNTLSPQRPLDGTLCRELIVHPLFPASQIELSRSEIRRQQILIQLQQRQAMQRQAATIPLPAPPERESMCYGTMDID